MDHLFAAVVQPGAGRRVAWEDSARRGRAPAVSEVTSLEWSASARHQPRARNIWLTAARGRTMKDTSPGSGVSFVGLPGGGKSLTAKKSGLLRDGSAR
jgi:hypothetical protein